MKKVWNEERDALLRRLYPTAHLGSLAARLGVTVTALKSRAKVLGLQRKVNVKRPWTDRQTAYLKRHYADTPIEVLNQLPKSTTGTELWHLSLIGVLLGFTNRCR